MKHPDCSGTGTASIDSTVAHSGTRSLKITGAAGYCNHVFAQAAADLSQLSPTYYVRFYVRHTTALPTSHTTFLAMNDANDGNRDLRMGGQNGRLQWNRSSDDATLPEQSPAGVALSASLPASYWACVEIEVDRTGRMLTRVDGYAIRGLIVDGTPTHDIDGQWLAKAWSPRLTDLRLGWESYGEGATRSGSTTSSCPAAGRLLTRQHLTGARRDGCARTPSRPPSRARAVPHRFRQVERPHVGRPQSYVVPHDEHRRRRPARSRRVDLRPADAPASSCAACAAPSARSTRSTASTCTARAGAVTALVGPNGSGKTTLLLVLAGLLVPDSGDGADRRARPGEPTGRAARAPHRLDARHVRHLGLPDRARGAADLRGRLPALRRSRGATRVDELLATVHLDRVRRPAGERAVARARSSGSAWPARSCTTRPCCCSTSPRAVSTRARASTCGAPAPAGRRGQDRARLEPRAGRARRDGRRRGVPVARAARSSPDADGHRRRAPWHLRALSLDALDRLAHAAPRHRARRPDRRRRSRRPAAGGVLLDLDGDDARRPAAARRRAAPACRSCPSRRPPARSNRPT